MATLDRIRLTGLLPRSPAPAGLLHGNVRTTIATKTSASRQILLAERLRPRQAKFLQFTMQIGRECGRPAAGQVDPVRGVPRGVGPRVVVPVEHRPRRPPLL